jgi:hypothetical protein
MHLHQKVSSILCRWYQLNKKNKNQINRSPAQLEPVQLIQDNS